MYWIVGVAENMTSINILNIQITVFTALEGDFTELTGNCKTTFFISYFNTLDSDFFIKRHQQKFLFVLYDAAFNLHRKTFTKQFVVAFSHLVVAAVNANSGWLVNRHLWGVKFFKSFHQANRFFHYFVRDVLRFICPVDLIPVVGVPRCKSFWLRFSIR